MEGFRVFALEFTYTFFCVKPGSLDKTIAVVKKIDDDCSFVCYC